MLRHAFLGMFVALVAVSTNASETDFTFNEGAETESTEFVTEAAGGEAQDLSVEAGRGHGRRDDWDRGRGRGRGDRDRGGRGRDRDRGGHDRGGRDRGHGDSYSVRCESWSYNYNYCSSYGRIYDVRLARQLSNTSCIANYNWGYDGRGIWVSGGCRADFYVYTR